MANSPHTTSPGAPRSTAAIAAQPPGPPRRKRRRWVVRILGGLLLTAAVVYLQNWFSATQARSRFDEQLNLLRAAGEPTTIGDLVGASIPDDLNAAVPLRAAAELADSDAHGWTLVHWRDALNVEFDDEERRAAENILVPAEQVTALLREAEARRSVHWQVKFARPMHDSDIRLNRHRSLANFLALLAAREVDRGNYPAAVEAMRHMVVVAHGLDRYPYNIASLVSAGIFALADDRIERLMPHVRIADGDARAASPESVRALIRALLDERSLNEGFPRAIASDRVQVIQLVEMMASGEVGLDEDDGWPGRVRVHLARGKFWSAGSDALAEAVPYFAAISAPDWPSYQARLPAAAASNVTVEDDALLKALRSLFHRFPNRLRLLYEDRARRRTVAVGVAIHLYAAEHEGRRPPSLKDLVPQYMPAIPLDPMTRGQPLRYRASGDDPMVYSVGMDGVDDDGAAYVSSQPLDLTKLLSNANDAPAIDRYVGDITFRLKPRPVIARPSEPKEPGDCPD